MVLDQRPEAQQLGALGVAADDGVRVPHRDGCELHARPVDVQELHRSHLHRPHVHLHLEPAPHAGDDLAGADGNRDLAGARASGQPAGGDARAVAGELGRRAVRVPDDDLGARTFDGQDFQDAVRADSQVIVAEAPYERRPERGADVSPLEEQVVVAEAVPLRESHLACR